MKKYMLFYCSNEDKRETVSVCIIASNNYVAQYKARDFVFGRENYKNYDLMTVSLIGEVKDNK